MTAGGAAPDGRGVRGARSTLPPDGVRLNPLSPGSGNAGYGQAMPRAGVVEVVGVYDADHTLAGEVAYVVGKLLGRRHCALCDVTHPLARPPQARVGRPRRGVRGPAAGRAP